MKENGFDSIEFICSGDTYYDRIVEELDKAQSEILVESYIFEYDAVGKRILEALASAAKRKIVTRLVVDGIGSYLPIPEISKFCRNNGIQLRVYRALPYMNKMIHQFTRFLKAVNRRNHRKIIVIDNTKAFVASYNISKVHSEKESGAAAWKDLAVFVKGPEVAKIRALADHFWTRSPFRMMRRLPRFPLTHLRSTHSMASRRSGRHILMQKMKEAQQSIQIVTPYFVPSLRLVRGMVRAAHRNIDIEIIIPTRSDFVIVDWAGRHVLRRILKHKIRVYQYKPSFVHAKGLIVDDWATLGSHNLNHRSLIHDLELDVMLEGEESIRPFKNYWQSLKTDSREILPQEIANDSLLLRMLCQFAFWFRNWL